MSAPDLALLEEIACGVEQRAGHRFDSRQPANLWAALGRRARAVGAEGPQDYAERLLSDEAEWQRLVEEVVVHETSFYRHAGQFRSLSETILPELSKRAGPRPLRLWSAACSTGEEPYSLAIAALESGLSPARVEIVGTDISSKALAAAEQALYDRRRLQQLPHRLVNRYFEECGSRFRPRELVRSMVRFRPFNLAATGPMPAWLSPSDLILCENVLIYFTPETMRRLVGVLRDALCDGGYLFLGYSETLWGMSEGFVSVALGQAFAYRRQSAAPASEPPRPASRRTRSSPKVKAARVPPTPAPAAPAPAAPAQRPTVSPEGGDLRKRIDAAIAREDFGSAVALGEELSRRDPESVDARFLLGRLYAAAENRPQAAEQLRRVIAKDPLHARSYVLLGSLCFRQNELVEAEAELRRALYLDPRHPVAWLILGNVHQRRAEPVKAVHAYQQALRHAGALEAEWDTGLTRELLVRTCEQSIRRLSK